jgi:hypothetical protein
VQKVCPGCAQTAEKWFTDLWKPAGIRVGYTEMARVGKYQPVPVPVSTREPNPRVDPVPVSNPVSKWLMTTSFLALSLSPFQYMQHLCLHYTPTYLVYIYTGYLKYGTRNSSVEIVLPLKPTIKYSGLSEVLCTCSMHRHMGAIYKKMCIGIASRLRAGEQHGIP